MVDSRHGGFQFGIELGDVHHLTVVFRFHIATDRQVVIVSDDPLEGYRFGEVIDICLAVEHLHDLFDVRVQQHVVISLSFEIVRTAGIDELGRRVFLVFCQHQNIHRDGSAVEQVGGQRNHGFDVIVVYQIFPDLLLGPAPVEDAGEADDGGAAFGGEVAERVQHKSKVSFGFGGEHASRGKTVIVDQGRVIRTYPLHRIGRVGNDGIERLVVAKVGFAQRIAELDVELVVVDVVQEHVHPRQVVGGVVELLPEEAIFDDVGVKVLFGLQEQRAGAASRVVNFVDSTLAMHGKLSD